MMTRLFFVIAFVTLLLGSLISLRSQPHVMAQDMAAAAAPDKILVALAQDAPTWLTDKLYTLNPDGTNLTPLFDFNQSGRDSIGRIFGLRATLDGRFIHFHSTHLLLYTPARFNLFRLSVVGNQLNQVSPGPNSGDFSQTGNSIVSGRVEAGNGVAYVGSSVYLEGVGRVNTSGDGTFRFTNVPPGGRWLVAYNNTLDRFEAKFITVVSNLNLTNFILVPNTASRLNFQHPVPYGNRIYHTGNNGFEIGWTDVDFAGPNTVYNALKDTCNGIASVDAFDVSRSGKLVVYDYQTGCGAGNLNHVGLYTMNVDGGEKRILKDMLNDQTLPNWGDPTLPVELYWSPDETKIAVKTIYNNLNVLVVFDTNGNVLGNANANSSNDVVTLHGWSPDGAWLLFSQYSGDAAQALLGKIAVNANGSLATTNVTLLTNQPISSATWTTLATSQKVYLPLVRR